MKRSGLDSLRHTAVVGPLRQNATVLLFGVIDAALVIEERLTPRQLIGCAVGFMGLALLVRLGPVAGTPAVVWAAMACIAASASYGFGAIFMKRASDTHEPLTASAVVHVAAPLVLLLPAAVAAPAAQLSIRAAVAVLIRGTITSGFINWVSMRLMREIPASAATSAAFMIP